jgi:sodium transport system permease protein
VIRDALVIYRKEITNLVKDRRTLVLLLLLPLLVMPLVLGTVGTVSQRQQQEAAQTVYGVWIQGNDDPRLRELVAQQLRFVDSAAHAEGALGVVFPAGYEPGGQAEVELRFDSTSSKSSYAANRIQAALAAYSDMLAEQTLRAHGLSSAELRTIRVSRVDTSPAQAQGAGILPMLLPYMILVFIFAGSMNVGLDTTAGEKERGSLASILVNQVSRTSIALGKVFYVISAALLNSVASFVGIVVALRIAGPAMGGGVPGSLALLSAGGIVGLLVTLLALSALAASLIVLLGSFAKTVKEGGTYVLPIYLVAIVIGVASMQMDPAQNWRLFLVPLVNSVFALKEILLGQATFLSVAISAGVNVLAVAVLVRFIARLYNSERVLDTV